MGCGAKAPQGDLARLRVADGLVTPDPARSGGRGAWIHRDEACLRRAIERKAFARAFRRADARVDARTLRELLTGSARKH